MFRPASATIPIEPAAAIRLPEVRSDCPGYGGGIQCIFMATKKSSIDAPNSTPFFKETRILVSLNDKVLENKW